MGDDHSGNVGGWIGGGSWVGLVYTAGARWAVEAYFRYAFPLLRQQGSPKARPAV